MNNEPLDAYSLADLIKSTLDNPPKEYTVFEAQETLRNCGILDENNNIAEAYKDIIVKAEGLNKL